MATMSTRTIKATTNINDVVKVIKLHENYTRKQCEEIINEAKYEGAEAQGEALEWCETIIKEFGMFKTILAGLVQETPELARQAEGTDFDDLARNLPKDLQAIRDNYKKYKEEQEKRKTQEQARQMRENPNTPRWRR